MFFGLGEQNMWWTATKNRVGKPQATFAQLFRRRSKPEAVTWQAGGPWWIGINMEPETYPFLEGKISFQTSIFWGFHVIHVSFCWGLYCWRCCSNYWRKLVSSVQSISVPYRLVEIYAIQYVVAIILRWLECDWIRTCQCQSHLLIGVSHLESMIYCECGYGCISRLGCHKL